MTAIIIHTTRGWTAISDFGRMIASADRYADIAKWVRHLGYDIISSYSRSGEAILEKSGLQKMKRTI